MATLCLLDTNILVHLVRSDATWQRIREPYALLLTQTRPLLSPATEAELRSLAYQWRWGEARREQMRYFLACRRAPGVEAPRRAESESKEQLCPS